MAFIGLVLLVLYAYFLKKRWISLKDFWAWFVNLDKREYTYHVKGRKRSGDLDYKWWVDGIRKIVSLKHKKKWRALNLKFKLRGVLAEVGAARRRPVNQVGRDFYRHTELFRINLMRDNPQEKLLRTGYSSYYNTQERLYKRYGWRKFKIFLGNAIWWVRNHTPFHYKAGVWQKPYKDEPFRYDRRYNKKVRNYTKKFRGWVPRRFLPKFNPFYKLFGIDPVEEFFKSETEMKKLEEALRQKKAEAIKKGIFLSKIMPKYDWRQWIVMQYSDLEREYLEKKRKFKESERNFPRNL